MREDADPLYHLRGAVLHQTIVGGDVRLAFGGVNNQRLDLVATAAQLRARREARAAEPGNAELVNAFDKLFTAVGAVIAPAVAIDPAVFAVGINHDAQFREGRRVCDGVRGNGRDRTGGWRVNRQHPPATKSQGLAAQDIITHFYAQLAFCANVLFERHNVARRQRNLTQRRAVRLGFHLRRVNAAVKVPYLLFSEGRK